MNQEQQQIAQPQNELAINLASFMTNKITWSLCSLLLLIILVTGFVIYKFSGQREVKIQHNSVFSNRQYDF